MALVDNYCLLCQNKTTAMEFPEPKDKRARTIRLFIGYFLIGVLIALATLVIVYSVQGYSYDSDKGIEQSGLVFIDAKPVSADIYIDGQQKTKTDAKISLNEGRHQITLKHDKYRDWSKSFNLEGGSVLYFAYPELYPVNITVGVTQSFATPPVWLSQSLDRHWLVMQQMASSPVLTIFDLQNPTNDPTLSAIPAEQLINQNGQFGTITPVEWADDNIHLLLKQQLPNGTITYLVYDRTNPDQTINISSKVSMADNPSVSLSNKKYDKYYVFDAASGELRTADIKNGLNDTPILTGVVSFKSYADNLIVYTTYIGAKVNEANVLVLSNKTDKYLLQSLPRDPNNQYLLDVAQYSNDWYYVAASKSDKKVLIYRNPLSRAKAGNVKAIVPQMNLILKNPQYVSFSDNARFIGMQSGQQFVVYDGEQNTVFKYMSPLPIAPTQAAKWMDGHRYSVVTDGKEQIFEFDGTNQQTLTTSLAGYTAYFDRDYRYVFTLIPQADGKVGFENGQLILN